jgi:hypothetical protein
VPESIVAPHLAFIRYESDLLASVVHPVGSTWHYQSTRHWVSFEHWVRLNHLDASCAKCRLQGAWHARCTEDGIMET